MTDAIQTKKPVRSDMTIGDVVAKYPQTAPVLLSYGLQCVGCAVNPYETIEQGALGHGMDKDMIDQLVEELNLVITKVPDFALNPQGITISPRALDTLEAIRESENKQGFYLKVRAMPTEQGLDYELDLQEKPESGDVLLTWEGFPLSIDPVSLEAMKPSVIDYQRQLQGEGFKVIALKTEEELCPCGKPLSECGCKNGQGCSCGDGGCR
jgi:iron-sulfur cluster assembly accessory protein